MRIIPALQGSTLAATGLASLLAFTASPARAQTEMPVASFSGTGAGTTGANSQSNVINVNGTFYGTTYTGGQYGVGTLFSWRPGSPITVLHHFQGGTADGAQPHAGVIYVKGALFGTTAFGGSGPASSCAYFGSCGTVFKYDLYSSTYSVLYNFQGGADGSNPLGGLTLKGGGGADFYGTTELGGQPPSGAPCSTTYPSCGTAFFMTFGGVHTVIHAFTAGQHGANTSQTMLYLGGALYGTTGKGGGNCAYTSTGGCGTAFKLTPGNPWVETTLHKFIGGSDGAFPISGLTLAGGWLYGTTLYGGPTNQGTVYRLNSPTSYQVLHAFTGGSDGAHPFGTLASFTNGKLYGQTADSGVNNPACVYFYTVSPGFPGCGTVFEVAPSGSSASVAPLTYFVGGASDGANPVASGGMTASGTDLYGTTWDGGASNAGTIFKFTP
jgi:uncharacterized repeat protein (TIGR03803 family)